MGGRVALGLVRDGVVGPVGYAGPAPFEPLRPEAHQRAAALCPLGADAAAVRLRHLLARSRGRGPSPAACGPPVSGRSGRRRAGRSSSSMPGPWSRTITCPSRTATSTLPPGGLHLAALSSRFETARAIVFGTPCSSVGSSSVTNSTCGKSRWRARDHFVDEQVEPHVLGLLGAASRRARARRARSRARSSRRAG